MYDQQLAYWRSGFPAVYFCVVAFEFLTGETAKALDVIAQFIGLRDFDWSTVVGLIPNTSRSDSV
jgi:hypothetical protein